MDTSTSLFGIVSTRELTRDSVMQLLYLQSIQLIDCLIPSCSPMSSANGDTIFK